jgi:hypothetical protein
VRPTASPTSARLAEFVLAAMAAEFVWLWSRRAFAPRAAVAPLVALAPGACLLLAVRAAARGSGPATVGALLTASLPFHLADMSRRPL